MRASINKKKQYLPMITTQVTYQQMANLERKEDGWRGGSRRDIRQMTSQVNS